MQYFLCRPSSCSFSHTYCCTLLSAQNHHLNYLHSFVPAIPVESLFLPNPVTTVLFFLPLSFTLVVHVFLSLSLLRTHTLPLSLHLPVKWRSFLLVVIKSKVGTIRALVFESSSGCQRAFIPRALDVPLMASPCLSCLPTMPLLIRQPITALRHCGASKCLFCVCESSHPREKQRRPET